VEQLLFLADLNEVKDGGGAVNINYRDCMFGTLCFFYAYHKE
jgi:hypothetical protein